MGDAPGDTRTEIELRIAEVACDVLRGNWPLADAIAERVVSELGLTQEHEMIADGAAPLRPCTRSRRWVTAWVPTGGSDVD